MKKTINTLLFVLISITIFGQSYKTVQLIQPRQIYLNGGLRSHVGGKSRTYIEVDLPLHTVKWYYSFTTSKGQSGSNELNLALQLSSLLLDPSGTIGSMLSSIKVPNGTSVIDVFLCNRANINAFLNKADNNGGTFYYDMQGSTLNTKQAVVEVNNVNQGTWFLGIKNPSSLNAVNITIEVVAIVKTY